jgi:2-polyprenyl-6-methoxyphenol hydroxylase-like FAD-dependent oxidoreductase
MALEDAVVLAEELKAEGSVAEALDSFGRRRYDRCQLVVETSRELSRLQAEGASGDELGVVRGAALKTLSEPY